MSNITNFVSTPSLKLPLPSLPNVGAQFQAIHGNVDIGRLFVVLGCIAGAALLASVLWNKCRPRLCPTPAQSLQHLYNRVKQNRSYEEATLAVQRHIHDPHPLMRSSTLTLLSTLVEKNHASAYPLALTAALETLAQQPPEEPLFTPLDAVNRRLAECTLGLLVTRKHEPSYGAALARAQAKMHSEDAYERSAAYSNISLLVCYEYVDAYEPAIEFVKYAPAEEMETALSICEILMDRGYHLIDPYACTIATQLIHHEDVKHHYKAGRFLRDLVLQGYTPSYEPARTAVERLRASTHIKDHVLANELVRLLTLRGQNGPLEIQENLVGEAPDAILPATPAAQSASRVFGAIRAFGQTNRLRRLMEQVNKGQSYPEAMRAAQEGIKHADPHVRFWALHLFMNLVDQTHIASYKPAFMAARQEMTSPADYNRQAAGHVLESLIAQGEPTAYAQALVFAQQEKTGSTPALARTSARIIDTLTNHEYAPSYPDALALAMRNTTSLEPKDHPVGLQLFRDLVLRGYTESYGPAVAAAHPALASPDAAVRTLARRVITLLDLQGRAALSSAPSAPMPRRRIERKQAAEGVA